MLPKPLSEQIAALPPDWRPLAERFAASAQGVALQAFIAGRRAAGATIYPPRPLRALELTPRGQVRAVILGQDPYHGAGQAQGLAFSVPDGVRPPDMDPDVGAHGMRPADVRQPDSDQGGSHE